MSLSFARKWGILIVLSLALAIIILDTTILNVALSSIIRDLDTNIQSVQWVITAYSLTLAALTITGGRMGDIFGRKRMFVLGAFLFAVGSFIASISSTVPMLIAGESIIEGIGAALMMPATASLLVSNFRGRERAIAFAIWGAIAGASVALGPVLGGYLATNYSWRWGFRVNLIVVGLLILGSFLIPSGRGERRKLGLDVGGVVLSAVGMLSLVFGIIESSKYGWFKALKTFELFGYELAFPFDMSVVPLFMLTGIGILSVFLFWEHRRERLGKTPLVSTKLFQNRMFTSGVFTTAIMSLGQTGLVFSLPVFLQSVRGLDAYHTGLALLPMSLGLLVMSPLSAVLGRKIAPKYLITFGLLLNTIAYVVLWFTLAVDTTAADLIPGLVIYGVGMGFVMSQINNVTLSAVEIHEAGEASGVNNTLRQVGSTLGSAIMGAILVGVLGTQLVQGVEASQVIPNDLKPQLAKVVETQTSNIEFGGGARLDGGLSAELKAEIVVIGHAATVSAAKRTLVYGALFALLGFITALVFLPATKNPTHPKETSSDRETLVRRLWDKGFGVELDYENFEEYLEDIPPVPEQLLAHDEKFPELVLVDARVSAETAAQLLGVSIKAGADRTTLPSLQILSDTAYWMRCRISRSNDPSEASLSVLEGLMLYALHPETLDNYFLDLVSSPHEDRPGSIAVLGKWPTQAEIRWRYAVNLEPSCVVPTKKLA